jgi:restriction system protein
MTPSEMLDFSIDNLNRSLADELLDEIYKERDWAYFEKLVLRDISALGYGGDATSLRWTGKSGDEGIDGEIYEDRLGFDKIYIQAKHYKPGNVVNDAVVRNFIGSRGVKGVSKGVIITTSSFTDKAQHLANG